MRVLLRALGICSILFLVNHAFAEGSASESTSDEKRMQEQKKAYDELVFRTGEIILGDNQVKLNLGDKYTFLNTKDSETILSKFWGNPPGFTGYGMIFPKDKSPLVADSWSIVVDFEDSGYISDEDADTIDYNEVLADMQEGVKESNAARQQQGYETLELKGWAEPPHYDKATHIIYWAKDLKFGDGTLGTLNYNIRILGRRGVLNLNVVSSMDQLNEINQHRDEILQLASFMESHRYADYQPGTDKTATYGLAALVAGGALAKKVGFFKLLIAGILASKKLLAAGAVVLLALLRKFFSKKSGADAQPPA